VEWPEETNPYSTALQSLPRFGEDRLLYVDESIRKFMADGFELADPRLKVVSAPPPITTLRERKLESEIRILRCANEVSLFYLVCLTSYCEHGARSSVTFHIEAQRVNFNSEQLEVSAHKRRGVKNLVPQFQHL
jgi:hypothetical protein